MTLRLKLFTGFIILIIIFIISFLINQRLSQEVIRNSEYINRSETVIRNSNLLHKNIIDMQSGYRGYLLTSQEEFLDSYTEGITSVPVLIKEQIELVENAGQQARLDSILKLHLEWVEYANSVISTKRDTLPEASAKYTELFEKKVKTGTGKHLNDHIRLLFLEFDSNEYKVRYERRVKLHESTESTRRINLTLALSSITLALISSFYIIRIITRRISKMVNIAQEISKGNFKQIKDDKHDELTELSESLNKMSAILNRNFEDLRQKNSELDQFAYVVSHDLKAPLRGIDNITTWMEEDHSNEITPEVKRNLDLIKGRARRLENMINGLLDYARIGRVKKDHETVDVEALIRDLFDLLVPPNFKVSYTGERPILKTEKLHFEQVVSNLISNAVKYNDKPEGEIQIHCRDAGEVLEFSIKDNGIGIQSEYFEKIFTIFQTLRERDAFESTGVGLAIVKRIIENKNCSISVDSKPGEGTTFKFTWPKNENAPIKNT